jgi:Flp pilus assembly protein TadG
MNRNKRSFVRRAFGDERGQVLPIVAVSMLALLGMGGLAIDTGHVYSSFNELQAATNAAALAGAQSLPDTTATAAATKYSAVTGNLNAHANLPNVTMVSGYPQAICLAALTSQSMPCVAPANANALVVKQQVAVKTYFAGLFGVRSITLTATAAAAMRGGATPPYNVAIIVDTTQSMTDTDSSSSCDASRISCSLAGVRTLLAELTPCASSESTCGTATNGNVANSADRISLFAFPNMVTTTVPDDYACPPTKPTTEVYTFPSPTATSLTTMPYTTTTGSGKSEETPTVQMTYQIVNYSSDYRTSDTTASLNPSSDIAVAVGGKSGCAGIGAPGGEGTYYAGAIYAAQASLIAEQAANPGSQNVIILLSDGDATATQSQMATGTQSTTVATASGTYPSYKNECHQAITAAQAATAAGTRVYTVAYGAEASGCTTDSPSISPCQTMEQMASTAATFFSDYTATGGSSTCISASRPTTSLDEIFSEVGADFSTSRLIPNNLLE